MVPEPAPVLQRYGPWEVMSDAGAVDDVGLAVCVQCEQERAVTAGEARAQSVAVCACGNGSYRAVIE